MNAHEQAGSFLEDQEQAEATLDHSLDISLEATTWAPLFRAWCAPC